MIRLCYFEFGECHHLPWKYP